MSMKEIIYNNYKIYITSQRLKEDKTISRNDPSKYIKHVTLRLLGKDDRLLSYLLYIYEYIRGKKSLSKIAIIDAHGYDINDNWCYQDDNRYIPIQNWIKNNDGDYGVLFIHACNPGNYCIYSDKSLVVAPRTYFSLLRQLENKNIKVELYVPHRGFIDELNIEAEFNRLSNKPFKQQLNYFYNHFEELWRL